METRGILCDLSARGRGLHLDGDIPPGTIIEVRCDVSGIGLKLRGKVVWAKPVAVGVLHGVGFTDPVSEEDALFLPLYVARVGCNVL